MEWIDPCMCQCHRVRFLLAVMYTMIDDDEMNKDADIIHMHEMRYTLTFFYSTNVQYVRLACGHTGRLRAL